MERFILSFLILIVVASLSLSSGFELQSVKDSTSTVQSDWNVISDSMMAVQLKTAPFVSDVIGQLREAKRNKIFLHFLSNNALAGDTIVFIEPIVGLTTKPWTLMSLAWIANERDSVCLYRICDIDARNNPVIEATKSKRNNLSLADRSQLRLCKFLDKDSLEIFCRQSPPHVFDMKVMKLMGTRVVLSVDCSFKIDCITFENFVIPEKFDI